MTPTDNVAGGGVGGVPPAANTPGDGTLSHAARWRAFAVCVMVAIFTILDLSKVNVALPSIEAAFGSGSTELQLIVSGFVLTFGLTLVPAGRLGDQRSRRSLFLVGLTLFTLASLACALAPTSTILLVARLTQGIAAGIQMPQVIGLIQELFQGPERGRAFGIFGATIGIATAFGPTLGGLLIAVGGPDDGWRWVFGMNVPLGILAIVLVARLLPKRAVKSIAPLALDPVGVVLFGASVVILLWPFLFTTGAPTDDPTRWWVLVALPLTLAAFVLWERRYAARGQAPLIDMRMLRINSFRNGTLIIVTYFTALPALFLMTNLYLQIGLGLAAVYAGMVSIGFALSSAVASWISGSRVARWGRVLVVWGLILMLASTLGLVACALLLPAEITPWAMAAVQIVGGVGGGIVMAPNQTLTLSDIPVAQGGLAGSIGQLGQRIGTAIGSSIAIALFYSTIYRERGTLPDLVVYHDAYGTAMGVISGFIALALALALVDWVSRRRAAASGSEHVI